MKLYKIIILLVIIPSIYIAQFSEVLIDIDYSNISEKEMFIFENFESEIQAYFMNNYFFDDPDELEITLDIHIVIENVNNKGGETIISAQILFSNQKDQHHYSKSFDFLYNRGEALYKTEMFHPLTSLLNCYAYLQIAYELDTYEYLGGNKYFLKAQNIASDAKNSMYSRNWQSKFISNSIYIILSSCYNLTFTPCSLLILCSTRLIYTKVSYLIVTSIKIKEDSSISIKTYG